jgi:alpha-beta hydrolase superfamily lysophospholipase
MLLLFALTLTASSAAAQTTQKVILRGHEQTVRIYGPADGAPVIVSSGDGGWMHLGPHVAEFLARRGFRVVGFDVRSYLTSFTTGTTTLREADEPGDYASLVRLAAGSSAMKPILLGVSEGAGLSLLAATDTGVKAAIAGVIGLGLPDLNELGWRWKDAVIYFTHKLPNEPTFSAAAVASRIAPIPLAAIHSTHDEFVPLAEVQGVLERAGEPKQLWIVKASNHRFSDNLGELEATLLEAIAWTRANAPR